MKTTKSLIRRFFSYLGKKLKGFLSSCKKRIILKVGLMSDNLNRQFWIVKLFSLIGAGTVLYWTFLMVRATPYDMVYDGLKDFVKNEVLGECQVPEAAKALGKVRTSQPVQMLFPQGAVEAPEADKPVEEIKEQSQAPEEVKKESKAPEEKKACLAPEKVKSLIRNIAEEEGFSDVNLLIRIAQAESQLDPKNSNDKGNYPPDSIDRGLFMINDYWHKEVTDEQAYDPYFSTRWTIKKIRSGGISAWDASKPNWN
jgi:hypothetical protein